MALGVGAVDSQRAGCADRHGAGIREIGGSAESRPAQHAEAAVLVGEIGQGRDAGTGAAQRDTGLDLWSGWCQWETGSSCRRTLPTCRRSSVLPEIWVIVPPPLGESIKVPLSTSIVPVLLSGSKIVAVPEAPSIWMSPALFSGPGHVDVGLRIRSPGESRMVPPDWLLSTELECIWSSTPVAVTMSVPAIVERQAIQEGHRWSNW